MHADLPVVPGHEDGIDGHQAEPTAHAQRGQQVGLAQADHRDVDGALDLDQAGLLEMADHEGIVARLLGGQRIADDLGGAAELGQRMEGMVRRIEAVDLEIHAGGRDLGQHRLQPLDVGRLFDGMNEALVPDPRQGQPPPNFVQDLRRGTASSAVRSSSASRRRPRSPCARRASRRRHGFTGVKPDLRRTLLAGPLDAPFGQPARQAATARRPRHAQEAQRGPFAREYLSVRPAWREIEHDGVEPGRSADARDLGVTQSAGCLRQAVLQARPGIRPHAFGIVGIGLEQETPDRRVIRLGQVLDRAHVLERNVVVELGLAAARRRTATAATRWRPTAHVVIHASAAHRHPPRRHRRCGRRAW